MLDYIRNTFDWGRVSVVIVKSKFLPEKGGIVAENEGSENRFAY